MVLPPSVGEQNQCPLLIKHMACSYNTHLLRFLLKLGTSILQLNQLNTGRTVPLFEYIQLVRKQTCTEIANQRLFSSLGSNRGWGPTQLYSLVKVTKLV